MAILKACHLRLRMSNVKVTITHLSGLRQGERDDFTSLPIIIGRAPSSPLRLAANDTRASARHAELVLEGRTLVLNDLSSTNGTYVNGRQIDKVKLVTGDVVEFGTGGPKLRFDFTVTDQPVENVVNSPAPMSAPANTPGKVKPVVSKPVIATNSGDPIAFTMETPANTLETRASGSVQISMEEREFPFRNRFKLVFFGLGGLLFAAAIALFIFQIIIWTIPVGLISVFLLLMGWSCSRINITANNQGIYYQGILRSTFIRWEDITELKSLRSRTRLLSDLVHIVRSRNNSIVFTIEDYQDGLELAQIISRRTRLTW